MSHEIRTPLNGILGMAQVLVGDEPHRRRRRSSVDVILESGRTLMALLNDVLDLSKIEAGKLEIARIDGDLAHTRRPHPPALPGPGGRARISTCRIEIADSLPKRLRYDPVRVRQCVSNLLSNAIKFTETGRRRDPRRRRSSTHRPAGSCASRVIDTGIGMDEETLDAPVRRLHPGRRLDHAPLRRHRPRPRHHAPARAPDGRRRLGRKPAGPRLDLPLHLPRRSRRRSGAGARIRTVRRAAAAGCAVRAQIVGARVLLVDDNAINRQVVKLFLAQLGAADRRGDQRRGSAGRACASTSSTSSCSTSTCR